MIVCPWCGEEAYSEEAHSCPVLREDRGEFNWIGWNVLLWGGLALAGLIGGVSGCVLDRWWPQ